jgi:hypothetical protein
MGSSVLRCRVSSTRVGETQATLIRQRRTLTWVARARTLPETPEEVLCRPSVKMPPVERV